jgi:hypothetical protein
MSNSTSARPNPLAGILVFGRPSPADIPQASWFKSVDTKTVKAVAESLKLSVLELRTEEEKALAIGVEEGVLKGGSRIMIGSVPPDVYRRIEEYARKLAGGVPAFAANAVSNVAGGAKVAGDGGAKTTGDNKDVASSISAPSATPTSGSVGIAAGGAKPGAPSSSSSLGSPSGSASPTAPWDSLRVGGTVLAAYWNEEKELEGFWPAVIIRADKHEFVLQWRDTPEYVLGKVAIKNIAILHPEFLASGE